MAILERLRYRQKPLASLWQEVQDNIGPQDLDPMAYRRGAEDALVYLSELVQKRRLKIIR